MDFLTPQIAQIIRKHQIRSLTVDVFDTILLNKTWPEGLQELDSVTKWVDTFQTTISQNISAYELYSVRRYVFQQLEHYGHESLTFDLWFTAVIDYLCQKYHRTLDLETRAGLIRTMLQRDLEAKFNNLIPNHKLIKTLATLKQSFPNLKIFYLATEHYTKSQIQSYLNAFGISIFDDGTSFIEVNPDADSLQKVLENLHDNKTLAPDFDLAFNLHIGDQHQTDYTAARHAGSNAFHYRPIRLRGFRTWFGQNRIANLLNAATLHTEEEFRRLSHQSDDQAPKDFWQNFGLVRTNIDLAFLHHLVFLASQFTDRQFILCDARNTEFIDLAKKCQIDLADHHILSTDQLTLQNLLCANIWTLVNRHDSAQNRHIILRLLETYSPKNTNLRQLLYGLCFSRDYVYSPEIVNLRNEDEFLQSFVDDLLGADPRYTDHMRITYANLAALLPRDEKIYHLTTTSAHNELAELFTIFAKLHGVANEILSLDFGAVLPEATSHNWKLGPLFCEISLNRKSLRPDISHQESVFVANSAQSAQISDVQTTAQDVYINGKLSPLEYTENVLGPLFARINSEQKRFYKASTLKH